MEFVFICFPEPHFYPFIVDIIMRKMVLTAFTVSLPANLATTFPMIAFVLIGHQVFL